MIKSDSHAIETSNICFADVLKKYKAIITSTKCGADSEAININRLLRGDWVDIPLSLKNIQLKRSGNYSRMRVFQQAQY